MTLEEIEERHNHRKAIAIAIGGIGQEAKDVDFLIAEIKRMTGVCEICIQESVRRCDELAKELSDINERIKAISSERLWRK